MEQQEREEIRARLKEVVAYSQDLAAPGIGEFFKPWEEKDPARYVEWLRNQFVMADHININIGLGLLHCQTVPIQVQKTLLDFGKEELGHNKWILKDLRALGVEEAIPKDWKPHWAFSALLGHVEYRIREVGPLAYLAHTFVIESVGEHLGARVRAGGVLGAPKNAMLFLKSHAEINDDHAAMVGDAFVKYVRTREEAEHGLFTARASAELYARYINDVMAGIT